MRRSAPSSGPLDRLPAIAPTTAAYKTSARPDLSERSSAVGRLPTEPVRCFDHHHIVRRPVEWRRRATFEYGVSEQLVVPLLRPHEIKSGSRPPLPPKNRL